MENVLRQAELLAEAILDSQEYIRMRICEEAALKDEEAARLVGLYSQQRDHVQELLGANDLDHAALAKAGEALEATEASIGDHALLKEMREARAVFSEMMNRVNAIVRFVISGEDPDMEESGSCGGSCKGCGGGCHQH